MASFTSSVTASNQCRRLASTRRTKADWFANGPTAQSSCWPGCPTTLLGGKRGGRGRGVRVQDSGRSISVAQCVNRARVTVIQAVVILASPSTGLSLQYCLMQVSPSSVAARYQYVSCLFVIEIMRRFLVKKTGDCGSPPTTKKPKADSERLAAAREYEDRRRRGFKAAWRDEFAWLTYEPAPADSDSNGAQVGAPAATGSASSNDTTTKPQAQPLSQ